VVLNLVLNARDAMTDGGRIFIRTQNVSLGSDGAPTVLLSVEDQGCGMDAQTLAQVFEPFFTTKGIGKGTGLGLSTVYGIVKQSGGDVAVRSEVGIGTTFDVFFPRAVPSEKSLDLPVQSAPGQGGTESVLLVEDEPDFLELTTVQLRRAGYRVTAAGTGEEALVTTGSFEILLTDLELPGMNGFELAERFTRDRPDVAVVYMSGYFREHRGEYSALPNAKMVQKPFREEVLLRSVREALEDRRS